MLIMYCWKSVTKYAQLSIFGVSRTVRCLMFCLESVAATPGMCISEISDIHIINLI